MERQPVQSSNLVAVGYDPSTSTLEIEFNGGSIYQYFGIPQHLYEGLINAESKGSFLDQNIKKSGYSYAKVN